MVNALTSSQESTRFDSHILGLALLGGLLLPHEGAFYFANPLIVLLLAFRYSRIGELFGIKATIIVGIVMSAFAYVVSVDHISVKEFSRAVVLMLMVLVFPFAKNYRIPISYILFAMGYIVFSQLIFVVGYGPLMNLVVTLYPYTGEQMIYQAEYLMETAPAASFLDSDLRLGGMFHNPNLLSNYLTLLYAVFIIDGKKSYLFTIVVTCLLMPSILYAGSRTGFVVFTLLFIAATVLTYKKNLSKKKKVAAAILIVVIVFTLAALRDLYFSGGVRAFNIGLGFEDSLLPKLAFFQAYIDSRPSVWNIFFGCFDVSLLENYTRKWRLMDSEWGNAFFAYGFIFFIAIVAFYIKVYRRIQPEAKLYYLMLLWAISTTILFSYRASFVFLLILSKYYHRRPNSQI